MKWKILFFLCWSLSLSVEAQQGKQVKIREVKSDSFPNIKGILWVRSPAGVDTSAVKFIDGEESLKVTWGDIVPSANRPSGKSVVFLVENHWNFPSATAYYKDVIESALNSGVINQGDEFTVLSYDCLRPPYGDNKQLLFPNQLRFTSSKDELLSQSENLERPERISGNQCVQNAQMYTAVYRTLELLAQYKTDNQKAIVVLAKDFSIVGEFDASGVADVALNQGIPVYGVMYRAGYQGKFGAQVICKRSYGEFWMSPDLKNDPDQGAAVLSQFLNQLIDRSAGWDYHFSFVSRSEKDGATHIVKVETPFGAEGFEYDAPEKSFSEIIQENLLWVIIGGVVLIGIVIVIILQAKKRKRQKLQEEAELRATQATIEEQKKAQERAKQETDAKLRSIEEKERAKQQAEADEKRKAKEAEENQRLITEMLEKGAFARFSYSMGGESGSFEISQPLMKIGRNATNHFHINHPTVSREHAIIKYANGAYYLKDLGSSNGTFVNGDKIAEQKLKDGDHVAFGEIDVTFHV